MKQTVIGIILAIIIGFGLIFSSANANVEETKTSIVLKKSNTLVLNEQVDDLSVAKLTAQAFVMNAQLPKGEPIYLYLYTPGGSISAGMELCGNLKSLGRKVNTITNFAASMGFQIAQCLNDRLILEAGELMSHKASGSFGNLEFGGQEPTQYTNRYKFWLDRIIRLDKITVARSKGKQTLDSYQKSYENELWVEGQEAVNQGYADAVVAPVCDKSLSGTHEQVIEYFGAEIVLTMSDCPLISGPLDYYVMIFTSRGTIVRLENYKKFGGQFGNACVSQNITQFCPKDITLTLEKIEQMKKEAINKFKIDRTDVIRGY